MISPLARWASVQKSLSLSEADGRGLELDAAEERPLARSGLNPSQNRLTPSSLRKKLFMPLPRFDRGTVSARRVHGPKPDPLPYTLSCPPVAGGGGSAPRPRD